MGGEHRIIENPYQQLFDKLEDLTAEVRELKEKIGLRDRLLTVKEVAEQLGCSEQTVYRKKEEIGFIKQGRRVAFRPDTIDEYVTRRELRA